MILSSNSLLKFLPLELDKRTLLIFDTIRFTIEMIDRSWDKLNESLIEHSKVGNEKDLPSLFINAWSIIDNAQRFIKLYELLPSDSDHKILDSIRYIISFRNTFAHLNERVDESLLKTSSPFFGALTWEYRNDQIQKVQAIIAISGIQYGTQHNVSFTEYKNADKQISNIILETVDKKNKIELNIENLMISIRGIIEIIENDLEVKFKNMGLKKADWRSMRDIILIMNNE